MWMNIFKYLCFLLFLLVIEIHSQDCGVRQYDTDDHPQIAVLGGNNATEGMWPWMAAIRKKQKEGNYYIAWCTGFLIDRRHVLSAAHCFEESIDNDHYRARIGSINQELADEYRFTKITVHDGYTKGKFYNDIAILTLDREVNLPMFSPICLPDQQIKKMSLTRRGMTVAGWGADKHGGSMKVFLQYLTRLPVISNPECVRKLRVAFKGFYQRQFPLGVTSDIICAGFEKERRDACVGDSGGPLMYMKENRWFAVGIVSFGIGCAIPGLPGGYTKIASHLDWISQNTRN